MTLEQIEEISARNLQSALNIIETSGIIKLLHRSSKRVNIVGSVRTGLLAKHLDIDIHFYTPTLDAAESFKLIGDFAARGDVESANFKDLSYTEEQCFEWHLQYAAADKRKWTFDLIQILEGSKYDGYFESVADKIKSMLTPENKATILSLILVSFSMSKGIGSFGFTNVEYRSTICPPDTFTAPISIILFVTQENPVVSISKTT